MKAYRRREGLLSVLALVVLLAAGVITQNPLINLLFVLTVACSIFAALVWFYGQRPRGDVEKAADTYKVKIGMVLSNAAMLVAVIFVGSILLFVVAGIATVGFCGVADWSVCRVLFDPD